jgi:hypothetical protein
MRNLINHNTPSVFSRELMPEKTTTCQSTAQKNGGADKGNLVRRMSGQTLEGTDSTNRQMNNKPIRKGQELNGNCGIWGEQAATIRDGANEQQHATGPPAWTAQTRAVTSGHDLQSNVQVNAVLDGPRTTSRWKL